MIGYVGGSRNLPRARAFTLSLAFAIWLALTFMLLGVFAALTFRRPRGFMTLYKDKVYITQIQEMMQSMKDFIVGQLRIACTTTTGKYVLPHLAARFRQDMTARLLAEDADLGVVSSEVKENDLECQYFFTDYISLIVPEKHPLSKLESIEPSELLDAPIILREPTSGTRHILQAELSKHDISFDEMNVLMEVGNAEATVSAVAGNLGASFVSHMASAYARVWGCVAEVPVEGLNLQRRICISRRKLSHPNLVRNAFWAFIHAPENEDVLSLPEA